MDEETQIKKNILDLRHANRISISNILIGSIFPVIIGILSLGGFSTDLEIKSIIKVVLAMYSALFLLQPGLSERENAQKIREEMKDLI